MEYCGIRKSKQTVMSVQSFRFVGQYKFSKAIKSIIYIHDHNLFQCEKVKWYFIGNQSKNIKEIQNVVCVHVCMCMYVHYI